MNVCPDYPEVLCEWETLTLVQEGQSIARYGDGELALAEGRSIKPQRADATLAARLKEILHGDVPAGCLVGTPNFRAKLPEEKAHFWRNYPPRFAKLMDPAVTYASSFITRPDNAPWLDVPAYWARLEDLWRAKHVTLVRGDDPRGTGGVSLLASDLDSALSVREVIAPGVNAWAKYEETLEQVGTPTRALLCLGGTATVMAVDLYARGVHAIDLGHVGMFLHRHRLGEPMRRVKAYRR